MTSPKTALRALPSVEATLQLLDPFIQETGVARAVVTQAVRQAIEQTREALIAGTLNPESALDQVVEQAKRHAQLGWTSSIPRVLNATGIILHTGLGRAPLSPLVKEYVMAVLDGYSLLAFSTDTGKRRERHFHTEALLAKLTGAETGIVVNNNAAATLLVLGTLCKGKEAVVSRGELVEIGGSFRMPDVMAQSGAIMREVGTTNKTHLRDYEAAIGPDTGMLVKVHKSNYKIVGFSSEPSLEEMVELGNRHHIPVYHDLGSGALLDFSRYGLAHEPMVQESVAAGAQLVTVSGDKLIGGPQSGIILGQKAYVDRIKKNPLLRATRCGKLTYAALEATLKLFLDEKTAVSQNTTIQRLVEPNAMLKKRALALVQGAKPHAPKSVSLGVEEQVTYVGGGSMPGESLPTVVVTVKDEKLAPETFAKRLRLGNPALFTRVQGEQLILDLRALGADEVPLAADALKAAWRERA